MLLFGVCFVLYFIKLSAGKGFWTKCNNPAAKTKYSIFMVKVVKPQNYKIPRGPHFDSKSNWVWIKRGPGERTEYYQLCSLIYINKRQSDPRKTTNLVFYLYAV